MYLTPGQKTRIHSNLCQNMLINQQVMALRRMSTSAVFYRIFMSTRGRASISPSITREVRDIFSLLVSVLYFSAHCKIVCFYNQKASLYSVDKLHLLIFPVVSIKMNLSGHHSRHQNCSYNIALFDILSARVIFSFIRRLL